MKVLVFLIFVISSLTCSAYDFKQFQEELISPIKDKDSQKIILGGTILTGLSLLKRRPYLKQFEHRQHESQALGSWAEVGDLVGQLIPNAAYFLYNINQDSYEAKNRAWGMFKATAYSGLTTSAGV